MPARPSDAFHAARIVVGVDFSPSSQRAVDAAASLARDLGAQVVLVHAWLPFSQVAAAAAATADVVGMWHEQVAAKELDEAIDLTEQVADRIRKQGLDVQVVARAGAPEEVIVDAAETADAAMIVVGSHGRSALAHVFMGSVAQAVVRGRPAPREVRARPASVRPTPQRPRRRQSSTAARTASTGTNGALVCASPEGAASGTSRTPCDGSPRLTPGPGATRRNGTSAGPGTSVTRLSISPGAKVTLTRTSLNPSAGPATRVAHAGWPV